MRSARARGLVGQRLDRAVAFPYHGPSLSREILADSPTGFWKCQESSATMPQDSSGNAKHFTAEDQRGMWGFPGPFHSGKDAARKSPPDPRSPADYSIASAAYQQAVMLTATNNWTLEVWVYLQDTPTDVAYILSTGAHTSIVGSGATDGYGIYWSGTAGKFQVGYRSVSANADSALTATLCTWYHIVACRDAGTLKYYVNGAVDTANADSTHTPNTPTSKTTLGSRFNTGGGFRQALAYAATYTSALSLARVQAHYSAAVGT